MLQDLDFGRLENEFYNDVAPRDEDIVVCFRGGDILTLRDEAVRLPEFRQVAAWAADWKHWEETQCRYLFSLQGKRYYLWMGEAGKCPHPDSTYESARYLRKTAPKSVCYPAMTAWHLFTWYRNNRFCGRCGERTRHDEKERMVYCPKCGNLIFPRISPAVIIAVTDGDRILLTKYAHRNQANYALVAGYTEIGETLEQTVHREVMEEVGLRVKNIRYYKSQPWGVDGTVLMGFFCDLDGDDTIRLDEHELALAQWHHRHAMPIHDDGYSLTREMMGVFEKGREPLAKGRDLL